MCIDYNFIHDLSGPNGAGKTTTMKMIIAEEHPTKGRIKIGPYEIESNDSKGFDYLGYCPQVFDLTRVSVQGVKSLGGHFACLCRGFEFYEVKKKFLLSFFKKKMEILLHFLSFL